MNKLTCYLLLAGIITKITSCQTLPKNHQTAEESSEKVSNLQAKLFYKINARLGEGPIWNYLTNRLYWVDIEGKSLHILDPATKQDRSITMPTQVGTVVPIDSVKVVVALVDGAFILDIETEQLNHLAGLDSANLGTRLNDGKCDPAGRLWVGSMDWDTSDPIGGLFMLEGDGGSEQKLDSVTVSNGIVWTADQQTMYYIDSNMGTIQGFDYDVTSGTINNERTVVEIDSSAGILDGMAIDEEGMLWVGLWDGDAVLRFDPNTGDQLQRVDVPAHNVTACAFGGRNLDSLFITTAREDMTEKELEKYPDAGSVFVVVPGVKGVKSDFFHLAE
ncbi:MAG: SMP-30/gluconolactonase/LRE family protein [Bacteroidota bacterium]